MTDYITYKVYKYDFFDEGWGCGWRSLQNCVSKLLGLDITINTIMRNLEIIDPMKYKFNYCHYGYLDGTMIIDFLNTYINIKTEHIEITSEKELNEFIIKANCYDYTNMCILFIHDGYIVMIDRIKDNNMLVVDPHIDPTINNFYELNVVGKGGIGWINIQKVLYQNIDILCITNNDEFLNINTPSFYIISKVNF